MPPSCIINSETLRQRFMGDQQSVIEMLECFRDCIRDLVESFKGDVAVSDQDAMLATVKKILSMATCGSVVAVQECALQMEHAVIMEDMAAVQELIPLLEQRSAEAIEAIKTYNYLFAGDLTDMA